MMKLIDFAVGAIAIATFVALCVSLTVIIAEYLNL